MFPDASTTMAQSWIAKLLDIVGEAGESSRKVLVFSFYRDVLESVESALTEAGHRVIGPLTGSISPVARQQLVDELGKARPGTVLLSQISAGGVGLNIQAASVVVICEPQLKPTSEWQAIARAHRQGQVLTVQVHRLLSEDSVDERLTELLRTKAEVFEEFAAVSDAANSDLKAVDVTESQLIREVIAAEQARIGMSGTAASGPAGGSTGAMAKGDPEGST